MEIALQILEIGDVVACFAVEGLYVEGKRLSRNSSSIFKCLKLHMHNKCVVKNKKNKMKLFQHGITLRVLSQVRFAVQVTSVTIFQVSTSTLAHFTVNSIELNRISGNG